MTIDVGRLAPPERLALERLVRNARFFDLPSTVPAPRGPENRSCRIRIQDRGREHTVHVSYCVMGPKLQKLIDCLIDFETAAMRGRRGASPARDHRIARTFSASIAHIPRP